MQTRSATKLTITLKDLVKLAKDNGFTDIAVGAPITVTYSATLNKDAAVGVDPDGNNKNSAKVEWGTKSETDFDGSSLPDETHTYTFDFKSRRPMMLSRPPILWLTLNFRLRRATKARP